MEIRFKQNYERTAKVVHINGFREKCGKQGSNKVVRERRSPFIRTCFREKCGKLGSNKVVRERRSPFIQTCFREKCGN